MKLIKLIEILQKANPDADVRYDFCGFSPCGIDSWRGSYDLLALGYSERERIIAGALVELLQSAIGKTFHGYKGGEYIMSESTEVWIDNAGHCTETFIKRLEVTEYQVIIHTKRQRYS